MAISNTTYLSDFYKKLYPMSRVDHLADWARHGYLCGDEHWASSVNRIRHLCRKWYIPGFVGRRLLRRARAKAPTVVCPTCEGRKMRYGVK